MIDWQRIEELKEDFGPDGLEDLLPVFVEEIQTAIAELSSDCGNQDIAAKAHFIKGSAANLGLTELTKLCAEIESGIEKPDAPALSDLFSKSLAALRAGL